MEHVLLETAAAWEHEGVAAGEVRPIIGAVDETFLERMMLVFMDLVSGYCCSKRSQRTAPMPPGPSWSRHVWRRWESGCCPL